MVNSVLDYGADMNEAWEHGQSPLHFACSRGLLELLHLLLSKGAGVDMVGRNGDTALHAVRDHYSSVAVVSLLLSKEADPNKGNKDGKTALHLAWLSETWDLITLLTSYSAKIYQANNHGMLPDTGFPHHGHAFLAKQPGSSG
jgi:ankyrin repeat protein